MREISMGDGCPAYSVEGTALRWHGFRTGIQLRYGWHTRVIGVACKK